MEHLREPTQDWAHIASRVPTAQPDVQDGNSAFRGRQRDRTLHAHHRSHSSIEGNIVIF
jgi:hypothetical protein